MSKRASSASVDLARIVVEARDIVGAALRGA